MSSFDGHIEQASKNLDFLEKVNAEFPNVYDWQVTISFYSALHLMNAHVYKSLGTYHRTHNDLANAISPESSIKHPAQVSEEVFVAYETLFILSRRARYLYNAKSDNKVDFTNHKHLAKSIRHLNTIMEWFDQKYSQGFPKRSFFCVGLKKGELVYFEIR